MAELKFTIPDAKMPEVTEAFGRGRGWLAEVSDPNNPGTMIPNPESEAKYAKKQISQDIQRHVKHYQGNLIEEVPIT